MAFMKKMQDSASIMGKAKPRTIGVKAMKVGKPMGGMVGGVKKATVGVKVNPAMKTLPAQAKAKGITGRVAKGIAKKNP